jgi:hypothetical protein
VNDAVLDASSLSAGAGPAHALDAQSGPAGEKAALLHRLVADLNAPLSRERSFRMSEGALLSDRFLLSVGKQHFGPDPAARVGDICGQLGMPAPLLRKIEPNVSAASCVHFGFEGAGDAGLYKVYFEFPVAEIAANRSPGSREPLLLHLAFKWDALDAAASVATRYFWHPFLSASEIRERMSQIYADKRAEVSRSIATDVLDLAAARVPAEKLQYLEVREDETGRNSFDLNLYNARLRVQDLHALLSRMRERYSISRAEFQAMFDQVKGRTAGHLAGGVHRNGEDFFNVYYGGRPDVQGSFPRPGPAAAVRAERPASDRFEYATEADPHFNYCLWNYHPVAPAAGKFRAVNLLYHSFGLAGLSEQAYQFVDALRDSIGPFQTVFGIKLRDNQLGWEYYFYDYRRREREVSISKVLDALRPFARCDIRPNENLPYFMFSIDIDDPLVTGARALDVVHMYVGNVGSSVSSGISYGLRPESSTMENFYFFFDAKTQLEEAANKIFCSAYVDVTKIHYNRILWPELRDCRTICVANKKANDCVYFSGINVDQLLFFLKRLDYPKEIVGMVETHRADLDHLLYDVGLDYRVEDGELRILKSGYYGVF